MRWGVVVAFAVMSASGVSAQVTTLEAPGNLAPTVDPGCVAMATADARLSPPDLALGVLACGNAGNWDAAAELYILILLRADFDVRRVVDPTAHQAGQVLLAQLYDRQSEAERASLEAAIRRFADPTTTQRDILCRALQASGVPQHDPSWMIQHGMAAFTGLEGDGLVPGFDPVAGWDAALRETVACD